MDKLFYYYTTWLAARLAGMTPDDAQRLAYYCQTMSEQEVGGEAVLPWSYQGMKFNPCVTGSPVVDDDLGIYNSELAFRCLPTFVTPKASIVPSSPLSVPVVQQSHHAYNPLTDIDWKGGGKIKPSFGQKVAAKLERFRPKKKGYKPVLTPLDICDELPPQQINGLDARLDCQANSVFARMMLNNSLDNAKRCDEIKGIELPLLGCRLFTWQNTWHHSKIKPLQASGDYQAQGTILLEAFYWTVYAIQSYLRAKPIQDKLHLSWQKPGTDPAVLESTLLGLFSFKGDVLEREFMWLNRLPGLMACYGLSQKQPKLSWWQGFRCLPGHLLEQAMINSAAGLSRDIKLLDGFKASEFFKLNKAAEYHTHWLNAQLKERSLGFYSTAQNCGDEVVFGRHHDHTQSF